MLKQNIEFLDVDAHQCYLALLPIPTHESPSFSLIFVISPIHNKIYHYLSSSYKLIAHTSSRFDQHADGLDSSQQRVCPPREQSLFKSQKGPKIENHAN